MPAILGATADASMAGRVVEASLERTFEESRPTFAEVARETGLFGSFEGRGDISENVSKYMKQKLKRKHGIRRAP